jgi:hypothetical protein
MKESELLGQLIPSHPDFQPIIYEIREKYKLPGGEPTASDDNCHRFYFYTWDT